MSFQPRHPRDLVHFTGRIARTTRDELRTTSRQLELSQSEVHRLALEIGLKILSARINAA